MTTLPRSAFAIYSGTRVVALSSHVDGFYAENHRARAMKTSYPVESGAEITDHAVREPTRLKLEGWVSNLMPAAAATIGTPLQERGAAAWLEILNTLEAREPLTVVTALAVYQNMLLVSAEAPVDRSTGLALRFTLELEEVLLRDPSRAGGGSPVSRGPAAGRLGATRRGRVQAENVTEPQRSRWLADVAVFSDTGVFG